jgi:hypothetical protein
MSLSALAQAGAQPDDVPPRLEIVSDVGTICVQPQIAEIVRPKDKVSWRVTFRLVNTCDTAQQSIVEIDAEGFSDWPVGFTMQHAPQWTATLRPALEFTPYWPHGGILNIVLSPHQSIDGWNYVRDAAGGPVVKVWIGTCALAVGNDEIVGFYPRNFFRFDPRIACVRKSVGEQLMQDKARGNSPAGAVEVFQGNGPLVEPQSVPVLSTGEQSSQKPEGSQTLSPQSAQTTSQSSAPLCTSMLSCSTEDLQALVRESDALRQQACGRSTCSNGNLKGMSQAEKELLAKGSRARAELATRSTPTAGSFTAGLFQQSASEAESDPQAAQTLAARQADKSNQINALTVSAKQRSDAMMSKLLMGIGTYAAASNNRYDPAVSGPSPLLSGPVADGFQPSSGNSADNMYPPSPAFNNSNSNNRSEGSAVRVMANPAASAETDDPSLGANGCITVVNAKAAGISSTFTYHLKNSCGYNVSVVWTDSNGRYTLEAEVGANWHHPMADGQGLATRIFACRGGTLHHRNIYNNGRMWCHT